MTKKLIAIIDPKNKTPEQIFEEYKKAEQKQKNKKIHLKRKI